jgi:hypothetical protein
MIESGLTEAVGSGGVAPATPAGRRACFGTIRDPYDPADGYASNATRDMWNPRSETDV